MTIEEQKYIEKEYMKLRYKKNKTVNEVIRMKLLYEILKHIFGSLI